MDENCDWGSVHLRQDARMPKNFQLELFGTLSVARADQKHSRWDAAKTYEFDCGATVAKYICEPNAVDSGPDGYVTNAAGKQPLEELQMELYAGSGMAADRELLLGPL